MRVTRVPAHIEATAGASARFIVRCSERRNQSLSRIQTTPAFTESTNKPEAPNSQAEKCDHRIKIEFSNRRKN